jgi:hypothetical protein
MSRQETPQEGFRSSAGSAHVFFGYQGFPPTLDPVVVGDASEVTLQPESRNSSYLRVFRGKDAIVDCGVSRESNVRVYVWGRAAHAARSGSDLIEWIGKCAAGEKWQAYKELVGTFVLILETLQTKRIHFVSDALGARPFYYALTPDGVLFGSDAWHLRGIGPRTVSLSPDAISTWLAYGFNSTETSLFSEYKRLAPGAVLTIEIGATRIDGYLENRDHQSILPVNDVAEAVFAMVDGNVRALSGLASQVVIGLSGGYDSRLVLGLVMKQRLLECTAVTVENSAKESVPAEMVARALGVAREKISVDGSIWDVYDEPFHFNFDGFPITKQDSYQVAAARPGVPVMSGFLGDRVVHGLGSTCQGMDEAQCSGELAEALFRRHRYSTFDSYFGQIADRILARAMQPMRQAEEAASKRKDVFRWADLYFRQRLYISTIFHQHLCFSEILLPFLSGGLIEYYLNAHRASFSRDVYRKIFQDHLPELAAIPHSDDVAKTRPADARPASRRTRGFALAVLSAIRKRRFVAGISSRYVVPRLLAAFVIPARVEYLIFDLYRIMLLVERLREHRIEIDWEKF